MGDWYYTETGDPRHKVPWNRLVELFQAGEVTSKTYVWQKKQVKDWTQLSKLPTILSNLENGIKAEQLEPGSRSGRGGHRSKKAKSKKHGKTKSRSKNRQRSSRHRDKHDIHNSASASSTVNNINNMGNNNDDMYETTHQYEQHNHDNRDNRYDNNNYSNNAAVHQPQQHQQHHQQQQHHHQQHQQQEQHQQQSNTQVKHKSKSPSLSQSITDVLTDSNDSESDTDRHHNHNHNSHKKRNEYDRNQNQKQNQHQSRNQDQQQQRQRSGQASYNRNDHRNGATSSRNYYSNNQAGNFSGNDGYTSPGQNSGRKRTPMDTPTRNTPRTNLGGAPGSVNVRGGNGGRAGHSHQGQGQGQGQQHRLVVEPPYNQDNNSNNSSNNEYYQSNGSNDGMANGMNGHNGHGGPVEDSSSYNDKYRINLMDSNSAASSTYRSHRERSPNAVNSNYHGGGHGMNGSAPGPQQGQQQQQQQYSPRRHDNSGGGSGGSGRRAHSHSPNGDQSRSNNVQVGQIVKLQRGSIIMDATVTDFTKLEIQVMYDDHQGEWINRNDSRIISIESRMSDNPEFYRKSSASGKMMKDVGKQSRKKAHDYKQPFEEKENSPTVSRKFNREENFNQRAAAAQQLSAMRRNTNTHTRTRGGFMANSGSSRGPDRRMSTTMLHDIAKAASDAIQLRDQQRMLEVERERFEREKREFSIYKDQVKQEYEMRKYEYDEQIRTYMAKKQLYGEALKRMETMDAEYSKSVRMHLDFQKLEEKRRSIKRRFKDIRSMHEKAYNLLEIIRNETIRLNALRKKYASKCKEMHSLINDKNEQHKQFVDEMYKLKKEMLYLPWLVMGGKKDGDNGNGGDGSGITKPHDLEVDEIRAELLKGWEELERERNKWDVVRRKVEKKSVLITSYQSEEKMLVTVRKKLDNARLFEKEWKQKMLQDINKMIESQTGEAIDEKLLNIHKQEIELECSKQSLKDDLRHLQQDQELLALQQKHLNEQVLEVEKTREVVDAKQARLNTLKIMSKSGMYSYNRDNDAEMKRLIKQKDGKIEALNEELLNKKSEISARALELEKQKGECLKLQMQLAEEQKRKTELSKEEERKALQGFVIQFQEEIQRYHKENVSLEIQVKDFKDKFENNEKLTIELKNEKNDLQEKVKTLEEEKTELTEKTKELNDYCAYLEDHTKEVEQQFNDILHANIMALDEQNKIRKKHINNQKSLDFAAIKMKNLSVDFSGISGGNTPRTGTSTGGDSNHPPTFHRENSIISLQSNNSNNNNNNINIHNRTLTGPPPFATMKLGHLDSNGSDDRKEESKEGMPNDGPHEGIGQIQTGINKKFKNKNKNKNKKGDGKDVKPSDIEQHRQTGTVLLHDINLTPNDDSPLETPVLSSPGMATIRGNGVGHMEAPNLLAASSAISTKSNDSSLRSPPSPLAAINNNNNNSGVKNLSKSQMRKYGSNLSLADVNSNGSSQVQEDGDAFLHRVASQLARGDIATSKHNLLDTSMENITDFARKVSMDFNLQPSKNFDFLEDLQISDESDESDLDVSQNNGKGRTKREESLNMDAIANHLKKLEQTIDQNHRNVSAKLKKLEKNDKRPKNKKLENGNDNGVNIISNNNNSLKKKNKRGDTEDLAYAMVENGWVGPHDLISSPQDNLHRDRGNKDDSDRSDDQIDSDYLDSDDLDKDDDQYQD